MWYRSARPSNRPDPGTAPRLALIGLALYTLDGARPASRTRETPTRRPNFVLEPLGGGQMARPRKTEYRDPIEPCPHSSIELELITSSPAFNMAIEDQRLLAVALAPPGREYPMMYEPKAGDDPDVYRNWLIKVLGVLVDCYPHPVNLALDCLRLSLIEINRGITPNLFKPAKRARGGKGNFAAQDAMNLAVLAASYIHDNVCNEYEYKDALSSAGTTAIEIAAWKTRIDPAFRSHAIVAWYDLGSATRVLVNSVNLVRAQVGRKARQPLKIKASNQAKPAS